MREDIHDKLNDEILSEIEIIGKLEPGGNEHKIAVDALAKLYSVSIDQSKVQDEMNIQKLQHDEEMKSKELEIAERKSQADKDRRNQYIGLAVSAGLSITTLIVQSIWMGRSLKFEETGSVTTTVGKNLFSNLKLKNK